VSSEDSKTPGQPLGQVAATVLAGLKTRKLHLAVAESLTGGLLTAEFVTVSGASDVLLGGIIAYQQELKHELLGVSQALLAQVGSVDPQVAAQMAQGVRTKLAAKMGLDEALVVGVSTTGVAGPDLQDGKHVGCVFLGISSQTGDYVYELNLVGDRNSIRAQTVQHAVSALGEHFN